METLYNGIILPDAWPPLRRDDRSLDRQPVPYLQSKPAVISIDVGRQLFVDDFLIEETTLEKHNHPARFLEDNPVLKPETKLELNGGIQPSAAPFSDGCFFDPSDGLYKLYYHAGWMDGTGLAVSEDGLHWSRKMLDNLPGTNRVILPPKGWRRDGSTFWMDPDTADSSQRYKMYHYFRTPEGDFGEVRVSHDGMHFGKAIRTGHCGDNTSFFYNPFRKKWVYSIRTATRLPDGFLRTRDYRECDDFLQGAAWDEQTPTFWLRCDEEDLTACKPGIRYPANLPPQLYHVNCVGYESVMLGMFAIIKRFDRADNAICDRQGRPKQIDLHAAFSRDGFHFSRDFRAPFLEGSDVPGAWDCGYLHACAGLCFVEEDRLLFPVGVFSGNSPALGWDLYAGASTGMATLRRDGFVSMHANWTVQTLLTPPVRFEKGQLLFVNADAAQGFVGAEILDSEGSVLPGFSLADCLPAMRDTAKQSIRFRDRDLRALQGQAIRIRFFVLAGDLYAFWVSEDEQGASGGYLAAGGKSYGSFWDK